MCGDLATVAYDFESSHGCYTAVCCPLHTAFATHDGIHGHTGVVSVWDGVEWTEGRDGPPLRHLWKERFDDQALAWGFELPSERERSALYEDLITGRTTKGEWERRLASAFFEWLYTFCTLIPGLTPGTLMRSGLPADTSLRRPSSVPAGPAGWSVAQDVSPRTPQRPW